MGGGETSTQVDRNLLIEAPSADYTCTQAKIIVTHPAGTPQPQLDVLAASTLNGISNSWNPTLYTLTFTPTTGSANYLDFQTVLRTLNFTNPSKALSPNTRTIRYEVPLAPPPAAARRCSVSSQPFVALHQHGARRPRTVCRAGGGPAPALCCGARGLHTATPSSP
jgi:hypothetical protein